MGAARWVSLDRPEKLRVSRPHSPTQGGTLNSASGLTYLQSGRWDSNPRRSAWKADTLPLSYARGDSFDGISGRLVRVAVNGHGRDAWVCRRASSIRPEACRIVDQSLLFILALLARLWARLAR